MVTHSSILAWRIPWIEEPDRLQSLGSQESDTTQQLNHHHQKSSPRTTGTSWIQSCKQTIILFCRTRELRAWNGVPQESRSGPSLCNGNGSLGIFSNLSRAHTSQKTEQAIKLRSPKFKPSALHATRRGLLCPRGKLPHLAEFSLCFPSLNQVILQDLNQKYRNQKGASHPYFVHPQLTGSGCIYWDAFCHCL